MATMNVSLPDQMKTWVEDQAKGGKYGNASDYVLDLIRKDKEIYLMLGSSLYILFIS